MNEKIILQCEDSIDGMLTAIYDAFVYKNQMEFPYEDDITIEIGAGGDMSLFAREETVVTDERKAQRTAYAIQSRLGFSIYHTVFYALCHFDGDRASAVLGYLVRAFAKGRRIREHLADSYVMRVMKLSQKVSNECDKFYGFLRFHDSGRILVSELEPKCNVLPIMSEHFCGRYPNEDFIIYDRTRGVALLHPAYRQCFFMEGEELQEFLQAEGSKRHEDEFERLWKEYYKCMGIKERRNDRCKDNLLPKWYRKTMLEQQE